jgi:hypothetical protein
MSATTRTSYTSAAGKIAVDSLTKQVLTVANQLLALPQFGSESEPMTATQGSYRPRTSYSGSTHTGCAAVDLTAYNWANRVRVLDLLGIIGCHRTPSQGDWPPHVHAMTNGLGCAAASLKGQITEVMNGGDGLLGNKPDPDKARRSGLWPLAVYKGRTGKLKATSPTHLYDGPSSTRKLVADAPVGTVVQALMEVRNARGNVWFVTDTGLWGFSGKWAR